MSVNNYLKELYSFETCSNDFKEKCLQPHCKYSVLNLIGNSSCFFTCGRNQNDIARDKFFKSLEKEVK